MISADDSLLADALSDLRGMPGTCWPQRVILQEMPGEEARVVMRQAVQAGLTVRGFPDAAAQLKRARAARGHVIAVLATPGGGAPSVCTIQVPLRRVAGTTRRAGTG